MFLPKNNTQWMFPIIPVATIFITFFFINHSLIAQVKKVNLYEFSSSPSIMAYNLHQHYTAKKGTCRGTLYNFRESNGKLSFGNNGSLVDRVSNFPYEWNIKTSMDNSTLLAEHNDSLIIYDMINKKVSNSFFVKGVARQEINIDGSLIFIRRYEDGESYVEIIDTHTGEVIWQTKARPEQIRLSPDNRYLALNSGEKIEVYDLWEGGEPFVHESRSVKKKRRSTGEFFRDIEINSNGLIAISYVIKGYIKKKYVRIQHYTVVDIHTGKRLHEFKYDTDETWYLYSLDPSGRVLFIEGKFFNAKTGKEIPVSITNKKSKKAYGQLNSWKFHPHINGLYHARRGSGVTGIYSFE